MTVAIANILPPLDSPMPATMVIVKCKCVYTASVSSNSIRNGDICPIACTKMAVSIVPQTDSVFEPLNSSRVRSGKPVSMNFRSIS